MNSQRCVLTISSTKILQCRGLSRPPRGLSRPARGLSRPLTGLSDLPDCCPDLPEGSPDLPEGSPGLTEGSPGLPEGSPGLTGRGYGRTNRRNFSPFYRTSSPTGAAAQKGVTKGCLANLFQHKGWTVDKSKITIERGSQWESHGAAIFYSLTFTLFFLWKQCSAT